MINNVATMHLRSENIYEVKFYLEIFTLVVTLSFDHRLKCRCNQLKLITNDLELGFTSSFQALNFFTNINKFVSD